MLKFYLLFLLILLFYFGIEYYQLVKSLQKIPLRILVNGTRGKSTIVKLIYEILLKSGQKVFAKTTGDQPQVHLPDGQTKTVSRYSPASIIENISILRHWAKETPEALVMECMALQPETQRILTTHIFKPNYILISNIHVDHAEAMGTQLKDMLLTIMECIDKNANILTTNQVAKKLQQFGKSLERIAEREEFPEKFDHIPAQIVDQNWSLIKTLANQLNMDLQIAYSCFREIHSSINKNIYVKNPDLNWSFWNLFSVNDHESATLFIRYSRQNQSPDMQKIILFNTRSDRPLRTHYFVDLILQEFSNTAIWLTGSGRWFTRNLFLRKKLNPKFITLMSPKELIKKFKSKYTEPVIIYGIGNHYGMQGIIEQMHAIESKNNRK